MLASLYFAWFVFSGRCYDGVCDILLNLEVSKKTKKLRKPEKNN